MRIRWIRRGAAAAALAVTAAAAGPAAAAGVPPELPVEQQGIARLAPPDDARLYVADVAFGHLVDGRMHVIDARSMRYLGLIGTGFSGQSTLSRDRRQIFVATTYHSRLERGERTDVVEIYGSDDLAWKGEVVIPPKHAQGLTIRAMLATTADDRFLLVQNATPASSVSVVDLQQRKFVGEIPTPGCWGVLPWAGAARRFSTVCGNGTLGTVELDDAGLQKSRSASAPFFDPDVDPVFMHFEPEGDQVHFVSYGGKLHTATLAGEAPSFAAPWSLVGAADAKRGWKPGGYQLFALQAEGRRLYVAMHDQASEGSHKTPAKEIWAFDLAAQRRVARLPGQNAIAMTTSRSGPSRLYVLDGVKNQLVSLDVSKASAKTLARMDGPGDTPIFLEVH